MAIHFLCEQCGHHVRAEDAYAGRRARCAHCGHKMRVPGSPIHQHDHGLEADDDAEVEFRLAPADDEPIPTPRLTISAAEPEIDLDLSRSQSPSEDSPRLKPVEEGPRFGEAPVGIPEELLADRAPIPLDPNFVPAPGAVSHDETSQARINARAWMYRNVRSVLEKIQWIENWLYVISIVMLMVAIMGLLLDTRPLAHFGASWVLFCSIMLAALGGIEVVIKPFQYGIFGTNWKTMKKQIRHALAAFIPLIVLFLSYLFIAPIRDYFLDTAEARQVKQMSSLSVPLSDPGIRPAVAARLTMPRAHL